GGATILKTHPHLSSRRYDRLKDRIFEPQEIKDFKSVSFLDTGLVTHANGRLEVINNSLTIHTSPVCYDLQFTLNLPLHNKAQSCVLVFEGKVLKGGINIGVIGENKLIGKLSHWHNQFADCAENCRFAIDLKSDSPF